MFFGFGFVQQLCYISFKYSAYTYRIVFAINLRNVIVIIILEINNATGYIILLIGNIRLLKIY